MPRELPVLQLALGIVKSAPLFMHDSHGASISVSSFQYTLWRCTAALRRACALDLIATGRTAASAAVATAAPITYTVFITVNGGFESCYLVPVDGNLGRVRIPMARNITDPSSVRVTVFPIGADDRYGRDSIPQSATTFLLKALPTPPSFVAVKVELGNRVGVPVTAGVSGVCVRVEVLDEFHQYLAFAVPLATVNSVVSPFGWTLLTSHAALNNTGMATITREINPSIQVPIVIHSFIAMSD
jgi:hypothetical protein